MAPYIHFTEEQKQRAGAVDLEEFLLRNGERLIASGREKRLASDHSVTVRGSEWYDHAAEKGGGPISFVQEHFGLSYPEAVRLLLGGEAGEVYPAAREKKQEEPKPFVLPAPNGDMRRVYAYLLKERCLDRAVVSHFVRSGVLYEDAEYHNCVFVGRDENGIPRHAHKRSTNSRGEPFRINVEGGDPRYTFHHLGSDGRLCVFEAPIDMLSFITLYPRGWEEHSYTACCGVSIQPVLKMLERMAGPEMVYLCLDNDEAGRKASERMAEQLRSQGILSVRIASTLKDWNEDLKAVCQQRKEEPCQAMCGP